jgi:tetratricopeptide (TPR) repeat protein
MRSIVHRRIRQFALIGLAITFLQLPCDAQNRTEDLNATANFWLNLSIDIAKDIPSDAPMEELSELDLSILNLSHLCIERSLELNGNLSQAWKRKGDLLLQSGRYEDAMTSYDRLLHDDPMRQDVWIKKGQALDGLKKWSSAIYCYNLVISCCRYQINQGISDPTIKMTEGIAWYGKACDYSQLKDAEKALPCFNQSIEIFGDANVSAEDPILLAGSWMGKGNSLCDLRRYDEAISCYDEILSNLSLSTYSGEYVNASSGKGLAELLLAEELHQKGNENATRYFNRSAYSFAEAVAGIENDIDLKNDRTAWPAYFGKWAALHSLPGHENEAETAFAQATNLTGGVVIPSFKSTVNYILQIYIKIMEVSKNVSYNRHW